MKQTRGFGKEVKRRVECMVKRIVKQLVKRSMKQIVSEMKRRPRTCYVHGKPWIVTGTLCLTAAHLVFLACMRFNSCSEILCGSDHIGVSLCLELIGRFGIFVQAGLL
jgi:hypothetical protein